MNLVAMFVFQRNAITTWNPSFFKIYEILDLKWREFSQKWRGGTLFLGRR